MIIEYLFRLRACSYDSIAGMEVVIIEYLYRLRECSYDSIADMEIVIIEYLYRLRACFYDSIAGMEIVIVGGGVNEWIDRNRKERKIMAVVTSC